MQDFPYRLQDFANHFIPITIEECRILGFEQCDIIFVTGDTYIDSPFIGVSLLGRFLESKGYKVGIIPQPDINNLEDITRLGEPKLFWGVSAGSIDSMLANYTALLKRRKSDDLTPGGINNKRPDRATIVYTNLIKKAFKDTVPIIIGGVEASTRRISHYDFWDDKIRRSILFDSKADLLIYGMAEKAVLAIADILKQILAENSDNKNIKSIKEIKEKSKEFFNEIFKEKIRKVDGICYIDKLKPQDYVELPSYEEVVQNKDLFTKSQIMFFEYINKSEITSPGEQKPLIQKHTDRFLIHNPPFKQLNQEELDEIYELGFNHDAHPLLKKEGKILALDTIPFSITSHRGCFGGCNFCSIAIHQGKKVSSRSIDSIKKEIESFVKIKHFNGIIRDVGGPTANMFQVKCKKYKEAGSCSRQSCLFPSPCESLEINHLNFLKLLNEIKKIPFIKKVFVASGIRYDLVLLDKNHGENFIKNMIQDFTSGQFKIAPEHTEDKILKLMGKPVNSLLTKFLKLYLEIQNKKSLENQNKKGQENQNNKEQKYQNRYISFYLIAAYPGCKIEDMVKMKNNLDKYYFIENSQVQIFTPLPLTYAALQYYLEKDPQTNEKIYVEKNLKKKKEQKDIMFY